MGPVGWGFHCAAGWGPGRLARHTQATTTLMANCLQSHPWSRWYQLESLRRVSVFYMLMETLQCNIVPLPWRQLLSICGEFVCFPRNRHPPSRSRRSEGPPLGGPRKDDWKHKHVNSYILFPCHTLSHLSSISCVFTLIEIMANYITQIWK